MKHKRIVIKTIQRTAPRDGRPGNILINRTSSDDGYWLNSVEWRNNLLGAELPLELPVSSFIGAVIEFDLFEVTQDMLNAGGGEHKAEFRGREVSFKKVGTTTQNLVIDFTTLPVDDRTLKIMQIKQMFPGQRVQAPARVPAPVAPAQQEVIDEPVDNQTGVIANGEPVGQAAEEIIHENLDS